MRLNTPAALPGALEAARRRIEEWRHTRNGKCRMPEPLWTMAARIAADYGVYRTARALRLDYTNLKMRVLATAPSSSAKGGKPTFFEFFPATGSASPECILELENRLGVRLRIQLKGATVPNLAELARSFCVQGT